MREAAVATEDERFYQHSGVDLIALLRAVPFDLSHFSFAQGASTIADQLAKVFGAAYFVSLQGRSSSPAGA